ncbi:hypothetical protein [Thalassotalea atypica]|uniref:hypothetical protein n=1 Tax=Thalassotalea atypica TaxID=2054316 RepID=UPI0025738571|nr:hypothetical protein [Thalassotalea atypica]
MKFKKVRDMYAQIEKPKESKNSSVANSVSLKRGNVQQKFCFVDSRHETIAQRKLQRTMNANSLVKQKICTKCSEEKDSEDTSIQRKVSSVQSVLQRDPCSQTGHDTSPEHVAIENEFADRTGAKKEYEIPQGSVLKHVNGINKTGYADLADEAGKKIYDIKRSTEGYPEEQLARYIIGANAHCSGGWEKGTAYGEPRVIPFTAQQNIRAYQDGDGVISYRKEAKGVQSISSFLANQEGPEDSDSSDDWAMDWKAHEQMNALMEDAGMFNEDGSWK